VPCVWSVKRCPFCEPPTNVGSASRLSDILSHIISTKRSKTACKEYNLINILLLNVVFVSTHLNIHILFGRCLKELDAQLIGQLASALKANHTLILHIAFVAHQYNLSIVPRIRFNLCHPLRTSNNHIIIEFNYKSGSISLTSLEQSWSCPRWWHHTSEWNPWRRGSRLWLWCGNAPVQLYPAYWRKTSKESDKCFGQRQLLTGMSFKG